ncbi:hypothetical protein ARMSODRAFT_155898 [Armillaria solidipes]|uniref:Uncharacterized protein n=1 Tax=Armillaria solidipes TaxID=1076256 RepID=A0A2H3AH53_9AGAR|nr:hypothetical protein ARMSODRAFT_155898 [Armillaria solidipes]
MRIMQLSMIIYLCKGSRRDWHIVASRDINHHALSSSVIISCNDSASSGVFPPRNYTVLIQLDASPLGLAECHFDAGPSLVSCQYDGCVHLRWTLIKSKPGTIVLSGTGCSIVWALIPRDTSSSIKGSSSSQMHGELRRTCSASFAEIHKKLRGFMPQAASVVPDETIKWLITAESRCCRIQLSRTQQANTV